MKKLMTLLLLSVTLTSCGGVPTPHESTQIVTSTYSCAAYNTPDIHFTLTQDNENNYGLTATVTMKYVSKVDWDYLKATDLQLQYLNSIDYIQNVISDIENQLGAKIYTTATFCNTYSEILEEISL